MAVKDTRGQPSAEERRLARKARRHAERRRAILDAARRLLSSDGIESFTIASVAEVAEVSKPAVYYYFESKEELVAALAREALAAEDSVIAKAASDARSPAEALTRTLTGYVEHYLSDPDAFTVLYVWARASGAELGKGRRLPDLVPLYERVPDRRAAELALCLAQGIVLRAQSGGLSRAEVLALCEAAGPLLVSSS